MLHLQSSTEEKLRVFAHQCYMTMTYFYLLNQKPHLHGELNSFEVLHENTVLPLTQIEGMFPYCKNDITLKSPKYLQIFIL